MKCFLLDLVSVGGVSPEENLDYSGLKGARGEGVQPPKEVRQWADPREEEHEDEMHEVRRRRLQRFSQEKPENKNSHSDEHSLDLD
ncbi:hypothetical protein ACOMHN_004765 [Nucella lapillus]